MRILVAEDDFTSRNVLVSVLAKSGHEVVETANGMDAWEAMQQENPPLLAIIDWMMPEMDGLEVCRRVRQMELEQRPYIIMLTALNDKDHLCEGLNAGADEYIGKPCDPAELRARVGAAERIISMQGTLAQAAQTDALTQLPNRAGILRTLRLELSRAPREGQAVGVALLDIDHFKKVNDTYGHPAGDDVLRILGVRCQEAMRPYDVLGRYGGEEFLVVAPNCDPSNGPWERLREAVASSPFPTCAGDVPVTVSIGVAYEDGSMGLEKVIAAADVALYRAKEKGRNRVETDVYLLTGVAAPPVLESVVAIRESTPERPPRAAGEAGLRQILIADDSFVSRTVLSAHLVKQGYDVIESSDGAEAWDLLQQPDAPGLAILDWMMPKIDGVELCERLRAQETDQPPYIILLTALTSKKHLCRGLDAGANDYLGKPYDPEELRARVQVGFQMLELQAQLAKKVHDLQTALDQVKTLKGIVPICSHCKKIRGDKGYWEQLETFVRNHSEAEFSHGICPDCMHELYSDLDIKDIS